MLRPASCDDTGVEGLWHPSHNKTTGACSVSCSNAGSSRGERRLCDERLTVEMSLSSRRPLALSFAPDWAICHPKVTPLPTTTNPSRIQLLYPVPPRVGPGLRLLKGTLLFLRWPGSANDKELFCLFLAGYYKQPDTFFSWLAVCNWPADVRESMIDLL